jgi:Homeodomain-like domain
MAAPRGGIDRAELEHAIASGATIAEIAEAFDRSKATVRYWLHRYGLRTKNKVGRRPRHDFSGARRAGLREAVGRCPRHGETTFVLEGSGTYRCKACRQERVTEHRRRIKQVLVAEAGGSCCICGYDRHPAALEFHHVRPGEKSHALGGLVRSMQALRAEAQKCVLLCSNCHAEVEHGAAAIPPDVLSSN